MRKFAELLDRLSYEPSRNSKLRLLSDYFRTTPDPDRGFALAVMTGALSYTHARPALIRSLMQVRMDPALFAMSYDYVGDLAETVALAWPTRGNSERPSSEPDLRLSEVIATLQTTGKSALAPQLCAWLDHLGENGRWALLKLITGGLRIGVSARLAKTAVAALGDHAADAVEEVWNGLSPPYADLFAWLEGTGAKPSSRELAAFRTPMLAHATDLAELEKLDPADYAAEWKWDGIRIQAVGGLDSHGQPERRLYSRSGDDISATFPDILAALSGAAFDRSALDGELLVVREGKVQPFSSLQQRLNRKVASPKIIAEYPLMIRAYDLLAENGEDLRPLPFEARRQRLEHFVARAGLPQADLSPLVPFSQWADLAALRADPARIGADPGAVEGVMVKRRSAPYLPGRPRGLWWKWKRDPMNVDAVMMYAQRGHGKRSSFYSDFTFGLWRDAGGFDELVPVGKAYFGFTDEELVELDKWVRRHTGKKFGPVREVTANKDIGLVLEIAFEGINASTRHKSGVAMRFPRISRIRWDKPSHEADRLDVLQRIIAGADGA